MATIAEGLKDYLAQNREAWTLRARQGRPHTQRTSDDALADPLRALDPEGWLGMSIVGLPVLCLGAGGGLQSVLCAAAGAVVTVLDLSPGMLELDVAEARRRGLDVATVEGSFDRRTPFQDTSFDVVLQPVSTCYVPDVLAVYREVFRLLKPGGCYIAQHKQPVSLQAEGLPTGRGYPVVEPYRRAGPLPRVPDGQEHRETDAVEYLHTLEQLIGGLCRIGFVVEGFVEPVRGDPAAEPGSFRHRCVFIPPYLKVLARRPRGGATGDSPPLLWTP